jgi:hypothetical protein
VLGTRVLLDDVALRVRLLAAVSTSVSISPTVRFMVAPTPVPEHEPPSATAILGASLTGVTVMVKVCSALSASSLGSLGVPQRSGTCSPKLCPTALTESCMTMRT